MTALAVLARARGSGLVLSVHGDRLRWRGPHPPTDLLNDLADHKAEVLALLAAEAAVNARPVDVAPLSSDASSRGDLTQAELTAALVLPQPSPPPTGALDGLRLAALQRPPSWADASCPPDRPPADAQCSRCHGSAWWTEAVSPRFGWRCCCCKPAPRPVAEVLIVRTDGGRIA